MVIRTLVAPQVTGVAANLNRPTCAYVLIAPDALLKKNPSPAKAEDREFSHPV